MKKNKSYLLLGLFLFVLSACSPVPNETTDSPEETSDSTSATSNVVTENQLGSEYYRPALDGDGRYQPSQSRGITLRLNSGINIALFEKDLLRLSQSPFPTEEYFMQEGQFLPEDLMMSWIGRESENNPEGLNPPEAGEEAERTPRYLNSILEFDFFTQTDNGLQLSGISIGLAMNSVDYYTTEIGGPSFEQSISSEELLTQGQAMADTIIARIREIEGLEEIPIMIGIYEQAARDDLAGGVYVAQGESTNGSTSIDNWTTLDEERLVFPLEGSNSAEGNAFANFKSEVESFFPNLSGVTGRAHYLGDQLVSLNIDIMTQFYGEAEIISFTQYLKQSATTYLPAELDVEIVVESPSNVQAFLEKDHTETEYFSYVFD